MLLEGHLVLKRHLRLLLLFLWGLFCGRLNSLLLLRGLGLGHGFLDGLVLKGL